MPSHSCLEPTQGIRIVVADRNHMGSQLLADFLARDHRFDIVAVVTAADVLSTVTTRHPLVVLISAELDSDVKKGFQITRTLRRRHPSIHSVILLETGTRESVIAAFRCGASGVFSRTNPLPELSSCIERVSQGEIWASRSHFEFLLEALRNTPSCEGITSGRLDLLSDRELQVAECAAQGQSNKQIADKLGLSEHTVKNYLFRVFEKLEVSSRFELLFLLFKECNGHTTGQDDVKSQTEIVSIETYLKAAEEGIVAAQFIVGLAYLEGNGVGQDERSAYYWLRVAEENSCSISRRSQALLGELRSSIEPDDVEAVEGSIAIEVRGNGLLRTKRFSEFIDESTGSLPREVAQKVQIMARQPGGFSPALPPQSS